MEGVVVNDFEAIDQFGQTQRLYDLLEVGPVVLFFYPKALTLAELSKAATSDLRGEFKKQRHRLWESALIRGSAKKFDDINNLDLMLLSDPDRVVAKQFSVKRLGGFKSSTYLRYRTQPRDHLNSRN